MRLKRVGRKHDPSYRIVVTEKHRGPKSGRYIEKVGSYDPRVNRKDIDSERALYWLGQGALPSGTVHNILVDAGVVKAEKVNVLPKKTPLKKEQPEEAKAETKKAEEPAVEKSEEAEVPAQTEESDAPQESESTAADEAPASETPQEEQESAA